MKLRKETLLDIAAEPVDRSLYVWGARGQDVLQKKDPAAWIRSMETGDETNTKEENVQRVLRLLEKRKGEGLSSVSAFDCSGYVYWALSTPGLTDKRRSAEGYFDACAKIGRADLVPGDLVFRKTGKRIVHVGIFIGGGEVIHCKGRDAGVVREALSAYPWNRYGVFPGARESAKGQEPPLCVRAKGTVRVRSLPSAEGDCLFIAGDGQTFPLIATEPNGWRRIETKMGEAYISGRYTELVRGA